MKWFYTQKDIEIYFRKRVKYLSKKFNINNVKVIKSKTAITGAQCDPFTKRIYFYPKRLIEYDEINEAILTGVALHELGHIKYLANTRIEQEYLAEKFCVKTMKKLFPKLYQVYLPYKQYQINSKNMPITYLKAYSKINEFKLKS